MAESPRVLDFFCSDCGAGARQFCMTPPTWQMGWRQVTSAHEARLRASGRLRGTGLCAACGKRCRVFKPSGSLPIEQSYFPRAHKRRSGAQCEGSNVPVCEMEKS